MTATKILLALSALGLSHTVIAQQPDTSPATFLPERNFDRYIKFPQGEADIYVAIPCIADVSKEGRLSVTTYQCFYADEAAIPFTRSIKSALPEVRLKPAVVDGNLVEVQIAFSLHFLRRERQSSVKVSMNHGTSTAILGSDYIDPQIIGWEYDRLQCGPVDALWPKMLVTAQGSVLSIEIDLPPAQTNCVKYIKRKLAAAKFIPASKDGQFVDALFSIPLTGFYTVGQNNVRIR